MVLCSLENHDESAEPIGLVFLARVALQVTKTSGARQNKLGSEKQTAAANKRIPKTLPKTPQRRQRWTPGNRKRCD